MFIGGYIVGNNSANGTPPELNEETSSDTANTSTKVTDDENTRFAALNTKETKSADVVFSRSNNPESKHEADSQFFSAHTDVVSLFNNLVEYSRNNDDYSLYGQKIDSIRQLLINDDAALAGLMLHFQQLAMDSQESYLLVSIIMGLPKEKSQNTLLQLAEDTLLSNSPQNETNFIELIARTGIYAPTLTESVIDIALYTENDKATLRALDILMPHDLSDSEQAQIKAKLVSSIPNQTKEQQAYQFSQLLRFSNRTERQELINAEFTKSEANYALQSSLMDAVHSGVIDRSDDLKQHLSSIARQNDHPLREQATYTLIYRFHLSQSEYQEIIQGQELELNRH
ncbi:hypothetical protein ISG33_04900 [Glaciecola sp. MH2013]|uniref:hypothetical protein n=1 Tax=Glaciecola sp. MH2013 TaxID=2785524 RepID=UPI00189C8877|nr:hypothetical protein [Glaciecola sp. MH2013]MBF7072737.1 hypothetical protein [Glaciecola sp. MH2013]